MRPKLTFANVISCFALFLALGGTALAATQLAKNSVGAKQLKPNSVTSPKVKNGSLLAQDFKTGQLPKGEPGPTGDRGPQGAPGATNVVVRYGEEGKPKQHEEGESNAKCLPGEAVTGGGFDFIEPSEPEFPAAEHFYILASRPSLEQGTESEGNISYPAPADGAAASGWVVAMSNETEDTVFFRAYVICARP
jgi:hypothetical protein